MFPGELCVVNLCIQENLCAIYFILFNFRQPLIHCITLHLFQLNLFLCQYQSVILNFALIASVSGYNFLIARRAQSHVPSRFRMRPMLLLYRYWATAQYWSDKIQFQSTRKAEEAASPNDYRKSSQANTRDKKCSMCYSRLNTYLCIEHPESSSLFVVIEQQPSIETFAFINIIIVRIIPKRISLWAGIA